MRQLTFELFFFFFLANFIKSRITFNFFLATTQIRLNVVRRDVQNCMLTRWRGACSHKHLCFHFDMFYFIYFIHVLIAER